MIHLMNVNLGTESQTKVPTFNREHTVSRNFFLVLQTVGLKSFKNSFYVSFKQF